MAGVRPFGVTVLGVLIIISGVLGLVAGIMQMFNLGGAMDTSFFAALVLAVIGLVYLLVARGLFRGSRGSRFIVAVVTVISLAHGIWVALTMSGMRLNGIVQALVAVIILGLLYSNKAKVFFS